MPFDTGVELKRVIENRGVRYLGCAISLSKEGGEQRIKQEGIKHDTVFFVSSFSTNYCRRIIESGSSSDVRILVVKSNMLYEEDVLRTYSDCFYKNALATGVSSRLAEGAFLTMFKNRVPLSRSEDGKIKYGARAADKPAYLPTHPGACILWHGDLKPKYIVGLIRLDDFLTYGPVISDVLEKNFKNQTETETNPRPIYQPYGTWRRKKEKTVRYGFTQKEVDERLEEAASRDAQFGTNEYGELFARFYPGKSSRGCRSDYKNVEGQDEPDTSVWLSFPCGAGFYDPEEESNAYADYGYLEDDDEEMEKLLGYSSRENEDADY